MNQDAVDNRSEVVLNLERDELYDLMFMAHVQDITLNQLVELVLQQFVDDYNQKKAQHEDLDQ